MAFRVVGQPFPATHACVCVCVLSSHFRPLKLLGQGGQGTVHLGDYDGFKCAGKTMLGTPSKELVDETLAEVDFFVKLDHPNCHYLLGYKTTLDNGGIMLLTEICELGSIYDFYGKEGKKFCKSTAWRLGRECALGELSLPPTLSLSPALSLSRALSLFTPPPLSLAHTCRTHSSRLSAPFSKRGSPLPSPHLFLPPLRPPRIIASSNLPARPCLFSQASM